MKRITLILLSLLLAVSLCSCKRQETVDVFSGENEKESEFVSLSSMIRKCDFVLSGKVILTGEMVFEGENECITNNRVEIEKIYRGDETREYIDFIINSKFKKEEAESGAAIYHLSPLADEIVPEQGMSYIFLLKKTDNGKYRPLNTYGVLVKEGNYLTSLRGKKQFIYDNAMLQLESGFDFTSMDYYKSLCLNGAKEEFSKELSKDEKNLLRAEALLYRFNNLQQLLRSANASEGALKRLEATGIPEELTAFFEKAKADVSDCHKLFIADFDNAEKEYQKLEKLLLKQKTPDSELEELLTKSQKLNDELKEKRQKLEERIEK